MARLADVCQIVPLNPDNFTLLSALSSCAALQFSVCSRAFIKLESMPNMAAEEREAYNKLALAIFTKWVRGNHFYLQTYIYIGIHIPGSH